MRPLAIDLYCGLGGWTEGLLAEGYDVVGFDIERHRYPKMLPPDPDSAQKSPLGGGRRNAAGESIFKDKECHFRDTWKTYTAVESEWMEYPAQLVVQDVLTLHGSQFRNATLIVASPPCQAYSYRAMPWKRAKALPPPDNTLFDACFRIQREACAAAGHHIPLVVENVRGAQKWVGRARWNFGSFYLWGDLPALMPMIRPRAKSPGLDWNGYKNGDPNYRGQAFNPAAQGAALRERLEIKNTGGSWFNIAHNTTSGKGQNPDGRKGTKKARGEYPAILPQVVGQWSGSSARKAASAMIAKIPLPLSRHIAATYLPKAGA